MLVLTRDKFKFVVPDGVAQRCGTLRAARRTADEACGDPDADDVVPVPNVYSNTLARIVQYYARVDDLARADASIDALVAWKASFFATMPRAELYMLMEAANYLDAPALLDDAAAFVADLIRGRTPDQIRELFGAPRDMTDDETRARAAELAWAIK